MRQIEFLAKKFPNKNIDFIDYAIKNDLYDFDNVCDDHGKFLDLCIEYDSVPKVYEYVMKSKNEQAIFCILLYVLWYATYNPEYYNKLKELFQLCLNKKISFSKNNKNDVLQQMEALRKRLKRNATEYEFMTQNINNFNDQN